MYVIELSSQQGLCPADLYDPVNAGLSAVKPLAEFGHGRALTIESQYLRTDRDTKRPAIVLKDLFVWLTLVVFVDDCPDRLMAAS